MRCRYCHTPLIISYDTKLPIPVKADSEAIKRAKATMVRGHVLYWKQESGEDPPVAIVCPNCGMVTTNLEAPDIVVKPLEKILTKVVQNDYNSFSNITVLNAGGVGFELSRYGEQCYGNKVQGLTVDGANKGFYSSQYDFIASNLVLKNLATRGIDLSGAHNALISKVIIDTSGESGIRGYDNNGDQMTNVRITDFYVTNSTNYDIYITATPSNVIFEHGYVDDPSKVSVVSGVVLRDVINYPTKNSGTAIFSGDGSTTQFKIAHNLVSTPSKVLVTPMSSDAAGDFYVTADDTYIYVNYKTAPPSGTDNIKLSWYAEV